MAGVRIAIAESGRPTRKLVKLVPLSDGGFAITAPYHHARNGFLFKHAVDYSQRHIRIPFAELVPYTAEDRVKLSLHLDGFVQFSGESPGRIVSGREEDGTPKGLGIMVNRLNTPLSTEGPTFGLLAWGIEEFEGLASDSAMVFTEGDTYYRHTTKDDWNAYLIEGFVYPRSFLRRATLHRGRLLLRRHFAKYEGMFTASGIALPTRASLFQEAGEIFDLVLVDLGSPHVIVALLVSRTKHEMESPSGFNLSSPSNMKEALCAMYPNLLPDWPGGATSLDYSPRDI